MHNIWNAHETQLIVADICEARAVLGGYQAWISGWGGVACLRCLCQLTAICVRVRGKDPVEN